MSGMSESSIQTNKQPNERTNQCFVPLCGKPSAAKDNSRSDGIFKRPDGTVPVIRLSSNRSSPVIELNRSADQRTKMEGHTG